MTIDSHPVSRRVERATEAPADVHLARIMAASSRWPEAIRAGNRSHVGEEQRAVGAGEVGGDRGGEVFEDGAVLLSTSLDDGQHGGDETTAGGALCAER